MTTTPLPGRPQGKGELQLLVSCPRTVPNEQSTSQENQNGIPFPINIIKKTSRCISMFSVIRQPTSQSPFNIHKSLCDRFAGKLLNKKLNISKSNPMFVADHIIKEMD